jgi:hypothetical protein
MNSLNAGIIIIYVSLFLIVDLVSIFEIWLANSYIINKFSLSFRTWLKLFLFNYEIWWVWENTLLPYSHINKEQLHWKMTKTVGCKLRVLKQLQTKIKKKLNLKSVNLYPNLLQLLSIQGSAISLRLHSSSQVCI